MTSRTESHDERLGPRACGLLVIAIASSLFCSCAAFRPATVPMRSITIGSGGSGRCLAVLLPGRYAAPEGFEEGEFGKAVEARGLDLDLVAVDAHLGYYRTRTVIDRLREDVVLPAKAKGYEQIWLVGSSLGGLGSIIYLREHPEDLSGVLAIAPFLGDDEVIREIEAAGGPRLWEPTPNIAEDDVGREVWSWLVTGAIADPGAPFSIGWGTSDPFDRANRLLASLLPPNRSFAVSGGHDMETWRHVWERFLDEARPCRQGQ